MTIDDNKIAQQLREHGYKAGANPWFTPRVMNRLPERQSTHRWVGHVIYVVAAIVCLMCWLVLLNNQDFTVITVRDITHYAVAIAVTAFLLWNAVAHVARSIE